MNPIKMFGLAALAALMAMAFVGVNSAMGEETALCKADENPCAAGNIFTHVHEISIGKAKFLSSVPVECDVLFLGDTESLGNPLFIEGAFTYTNCGSCTVTEENGPSQIGVLKYEHEKAFEVIEFLVYINCSGFIKCRYLGEGLEGIAIGPLLSTQANGEVSYQGQELTWESGPFCPKPVKLDMTTTPLVATYISK